MSLPQEVLSLPHWTAHNNKRPIIPPDKWNEALTYDQAIKLAKEKALHGIGLLLAPATETNLLIIDVDYPGSKPGMTKAEIKQEKAQIGKYIEDNNILLGSEEHELYLRPTLNQLTDTSIERLLESTYVEYSPSKIGLRILITSKDKAKFTKAYKKSNKFDGQIDVQNQFMTITGNQRPRSTDTLAEVPLLSLADVFEFRPVAQQQQQSDPTLEPALPNDKTIRDALALLPMDQSPRIQSLWAEVTGSKYEHYTYWLSVGMALHDYAIKAEKPGLLARMYLSYLQWSETDEEGFESEDDVETKWRSFSTTTGKTTLTYKTILKLAERLRFNYPRPQYNDKGLTTGNPLINEYVNFQYLLDFYNITIYEDDGFYLTGDKDIMEKYFETHGATKALDRFWGPYSKDSLKAATLMLCQDSKWRRLSSTATLVDTWLQLRRKPLDIITEWLNTPFDQLPENLQYINTPKGRLRADKFNDNSNMDFVFNCLNTQSTDRTVEQAIYKAMLKKTLMQLIKFREPPLTPFTDNGGMLILVGVENTYKSTFFKLLLPQSFGHMRKEINMQLSGDKNIRDFVRQLGRKTIIQIDEFEGIMDQKTHGSMFKAIISGDNTSFTDIFQTSETLAPRKAIIVGTTNETRLSLSSNGSRRMWLVKVNKIKTTELLYINLHKLYNDLRDEYRQEIAEGNTPWLLTQDEIDNLYNMNELLSAKSDLAIWLDEVWPITFTLNDESRVEYLSKASSIQTDTSGVLWSTVEVSKALSYAGAPPTITKLSALERALERHCGRFTDTLNKRVECFKPKGIILNGYIGQGQKANGKFKYQKWILPAKKQ